VKNLLYKEFTLAVHPAYLVAGVVFGALAMIPQWIFLLIPLYFCFVTVPNLLGQYKANKDNQFSALLPVARSDAVKARILTFVILEVLHVIGILVFAFVRRAVYEIPNFGLDINAAYFGVVLIIYATFNLILFPLYYRTAYKFGVPVVLSMVAVVLVAAAVEVLSGTSAAFRHFMERREDVQIFLPIAGLALFAGASYLAYRISARRFEHVEL
jgi:hypothetical protein